MKGISLFLALFSFSAVASAIPVNVLYEELKESGAHYEVIGMVCEKVAIIELAKVYPAKDFEIVNGISYGDGQRTIGELDVVIFDRRSNDAVLVGEVKCWKSFSGGRSKAMDQRRRFQSHINKRIEMVDGDHKQYNSRQFRNVQKFVAISQKGGRAAGFDLELENSLNELMDLRGQLMKCQDQGRCPRH
ncbi:MAG: hypothetical protein KF681_00755 [Bdellovibrionaceae bacterium]|nr:hypothetical protein [Pseudobdellovibrionaceae bacterium]